VPPPLLAPRKIARHLFVLAIVGGCVAAGLWQLSRLHWQNGFDARVAMRLRAPTVPLESLIGRGPGQNPDAVTYRRVEVSGTYDSAHETVLVARTLNDQNGNHVLTPLVLADGNAIVVDRGWIPFDLQRPPIAEASPPAGTVELTGVLFPSEVRDSGGTMAPAGAVFTRIDLARLGRRFPYPIEPFYLWLTTQSPQQTASLPQLAPLPDLTVSPPHLSYTIQWFLFAAIGIIGYPVVLRRELLRGRAGEST
jgi:cytochrome oxidase assembly protein ShyY1